MKVTLKCLSIGTPKTINFPFVPNGKLMFLGVPVLKHFRVGQDSIVCFQIPYFKCSTIQFSCLLTYRRSRIKLVNLMQIFKLKW